MQATAKSKRRRSGKPIKNPLEMSLGSELSSPRAQVVRILFRTLSQLSQETGSDNPDGFGYHCERAPASVRVDM